MEEAGVIKVRYFILNDLKNIFNIFKASGLKQDGPVEEGGMIKVRLFYKFCFNTLIISNIVVLWDGSVQSHGRRWSDKGKIFFLNVLSQDIQG